MDDLPVQELNPQRSQSHRSLSALRKIRQTWKAKAFDEMTRSTEKALREGTPAEKKVALQVANAAAGAIASVGGRTQEQWRKQIFNVKTFRGMASKGGSTKKRLLTRSWWQACELSATRARNGTGSLASQSTR